MDRLCSYLHTIVLWTRPFNWPILMWPWLTDGLGIYYCFSQNWNIDNNFYLLIDFVHTHNITKNKTFQVTQMHTALTFKWPWSVTLIFLKKWIITFWFVNIFHLYTHSNSMYLRLFSFQWPIDKRPWPSDEFDLFSRALVVIKEKIFTISEGLHSIFDKSDLPIIWSSDAEV